MNERGKVVSRFPVDFFLSHSAEKFRRGEFFSVSLISGFEKICIRGGGGGGGGGRVRGSIKIYRRNLFVSQCRNFSYVNPSVVFQKNSGGEKFMVKRGGSIKIFRRDFFVSQ